MNRGYRIRYGAEPYVPTRLSVNTMTGVEHILFTEREGETYGDVKNALLPYVGLSGFDKTLLRCQLLFTWKNTDGIINSTDYDNNDLNNQIIPPGEHPDIHIMIREQLIWTAEQQQVIAKLSGQNVDTGIVELSDIDTPDKMEACLWSIQNNPIRQLTLRSYISLEVIMRIMNFMEENQFIEFLLLETRLNENETAEFFERIGRNNTIRSLILRNIGIKYRINDLADCLRVNTYLRYVNVISCHVIIDEHTTLANVLVDHPTLDVLGLRGNITIAGLNQELAVVIENENRFIESLHQIGAEANPTGEGVDVTWRNV